MLEENVIFKCMSGSYLYGTNSETSDKDYRGVFLPNLDDLILAKAPKHYTSSTGSKNDKNTSEDIDETYYSLHYFLELAAKGDTNAIDMLFAYTNKEAVIETSDVWNELIENMDKILTRNVKAYLGYCKGQCIKYSVKGEKLNNFKNFRDFCEMHLYDIDRNGNKLALKDVLINLGYGEYIPKTQSEKIKFDRIDFGGHCYITTEWNKENYISISDVKISLNDNISDAMRKINEVIKSYGKRSENAASNNGADYKAISHCVRVLLQVEQLLTENKITFPLNEADFVKSIKYNQTDMSYDDIMKWIEDKMKYIDEKLLPNSTLREKADYEWIERFILKQYGV